MSSASGSLPEWVRLLSDRMDDLFASCGPAEAGWTSLADLTAGAPALADFHAAQTLGSAGLDKRGQAAYLVGSLCYRLSRVVAAIHLACSAVPRLDPNRLFFRIERYRWEHEGESGESNRLLLRLAPDTALATGDAGDRLAIFARDIEAVIAPFIERQVRETALGHAAQFRLGADSIASGFQYSGRALDCEPRAREDALAVIRSEGSKFRNPQTHFAEIALCDPAHPEIVLISETFRMRGGCCRYYTAEGGEYCSTCVLRKPEDREDILRNYLRRKLESAA